MVVKNKKKGLDIILSNGMTINQKEIAKIEGYIYRMNKKIEFKIDLNNGKDIYKLFKNFTKEMEENISKIQEAVR